MRLCSVEQLLQQSILSQSQLHLTKNSTAANHMAVSFCWRPVRSQVLPALYRWRSRAIVAFPRVIATAAAGPTAGAPPTRTALDMLAGLRVASASAVASALPPGIAMLIDALEALGGMIDGPERRDVVHLGAAAAVRMMLQQQRAAAAARSLDGCSTPDTATLDLLSRVESAMHPAVRSKLHLLKRVTGADGRARIRELRRAVKLAHAVYADRALEFSRRSGLPPDAILDASWSTPVGVVLPAYALVRDGERFVLAIRGSQGLGDALIDACCAPAAHAGGWVHAGVLAATRALLDRIIPALAEARVAHPGLPLVLLGHSLGGGIAAVAAMELRGEAGDASSPWPDATAIAVGPPAVMSHGLAAASRQFVTSIVHDGDAVPRFGVLAVESLRLELAGADTGAELGQLISGRLAAAFAGRGSASGVADSAAVTGAAMDVAVRAWGNVVSVARRTPAASISGTDGSWLNRRRSASASPARASPHTRVLSTPPAAATPSQSGRCAADTGKQVPSASAQSSSAAAADAVASWVQDAVSRVGAALMTTSTPSTRGAVVFPAAGSATPPTASGGPSLLSLTDERHEAAAAAPGSGVDEAMSWWRSLSFAAAAADSSSGNAGSKPAGNASSPHSAATAGIATADSAAFAAVEAVLRGGGARRSALEAAIVALSSALQPIVPTARASASLGAFSKELVSQHGGTTAPSEAAAVDVAAVRSTSLPSHVRPRLEPLVFFPPGRLFVLLWRSSAAKVATLRYHEARPADGSEAAKGANLAVRGEVVGATRMTTAAPTCDDDRDKRVDATGADDVSVDAAPGAVFAALMRGASARERAHIQRLFFDKALTARHPLPEAGAFRNVVLCEVVDDAIDSGILEDNATAVGADSPASAATHAAPSGAWDASLLFTDALIMSTYMIRDHVTSSYAGALEHLEATEARSLLTDNSRPVASQ